MYSLNGHRPSTTQTVTVGGSIGDTLEMWTNGELTATSHRVRKVDVERYSFPLFFACDYDVEVQPLPSFVSAERPARRPLARRR